MIPEFLKKYEASLERYSKAFVKIEAKPSEVLPLNDGMSIFASKFLGQPFFPKGKEYPMDKIGKPMVPIAQINFAEIPSLPNFPEEGILQLFLSSTDWYELDAKIIYHSKETLSTAPLTDFTFLAPKDYEEIPIYKVHKLTFESAIDNGGSEDAQFDFLFDGKSYWEYIDQLSEEQEMEMSDYFDAAGHKIGGYAEFTQEDPRELDSANKADIQILQIDSGDEVMFGDAGLGHVFISEENLKNRDFEKAYFYWDCS